MNEKSFWCNSGISGVVKFFHLTASPASIKSGLRVSGNYPFNTNVFPDEAFIGLYVTNRLTPPTEAAVCRYG
jgi:hypothetical protein